MESRGLSVRVLRNDGTQLPVLLHNAVPYIIAEPGALCASALLGGDQTPGCRAAARVAAAATAARRPTRESCRARAPPAKCWCKRRAVAAVLRHLSQRVDANALAAPFTTNTKTKGTVFTVEVACGHSDPFTTRVAVDLYLDGNGVGYMEMLPHGGAAVFNGFHIESECEQRAPGEGTLMFCLRLVVCACMCGVRVCTRLRRCSGVLQGPAPPFYPRPHPPPPTPHLSPLAAMTHDFESVSTYQVCVCSF